MIRSRINVAFPFIAVRQHLDIFAIQDASCPAAQPASAAVTAAMCLQLHDDLCCAATQHYSHTS